MMQLQRIFAAICVVCLGTQCITQCPTTEAAKRTQMESLYDPTSCIEIMPCNFWESIQTDKQGAQNSELREGIVSEAFSAVNASTENSVQTATGVTAPPLATETTEIFPLETTCPISTQTTSIPTTTQEITTESIESIEATAAEQETPSSFEQEETEASGESAEANEAQELFSEMETWFKTYMDYRTISDSNSTQYALQQQAWTDSQGLRRIGEDYMVAMGTGWLTEGCGERFLITLETGTQFSVIVGDIKADCDTDSTRRYRVCDNGANVLEFIVDTDYLSKEARNAGTVSVYDALAGNIAAIAALE